MTATTVGMDWGLVALGITVTPRKSRVTIVRTKELTERYGAHAAVSNVSIDLRRIDDVEFRGSNGSDKSTTIEMRPGLIQPSTGLAERFDRRVEQRAEELVSAVSVIASPADDPQLSYRERLKSLDHLRLGGTVDVLHVTTTMLESFSASTATAPPARHMVAAGMPADAI